MATTERSDALVLFGATGDLSRRKLFPALYHMEGHGTLKVPVIGVARSDWTDDAFRQHAHDSIIAAIPDAKAAVIDALLTRLDLIQGERLYPAVAALDAFTRRSRDEAIEPLLIVQMSRFHPWTGDGVLRVLEAEAGLDLGNEAKFVAGHSLGEYSALAAAGTFSIADAARLLRTRGKAMQAGPSARSAATG